MVSKCSKSLLYLYEKMLMFTDTVRIKNDETNISFSYDIIDEKLRWIWFSYENSYNFVLRYEAV